jgi:hypothetical protein
MGKAIQVQTGKEGEIFCKWLDSRLIQHNKNVLGAELGPTGSGKSYRDLRKAELWYKYHFKEDFPVENICFGVGQLMKLISSGKMRRGEVLIFEEAGVNLASLDFQSKVSKMMTYVLQSFRSMNIAIFFNLPYLSMLNKSARMLMHYSFESAGIDHKRKINKCKPFFHQVNQSSGKIYTKYPIVKTSKGTRKVKRFGFSMPAPYLIEAYESKKASYLKEITTDYSKQIEEMNGGTKALVPPKEFEFECFNLERVGTSVHDIAKKLGKSERSVYRYIENVEKWRERTNKDNITKEIA